MIPLSCKLFKLPIESEYFCNLRMYCICMCCVWGTGVIFTLLYVLLSSVTGYVYCKWTSRRPFFVVYIYNFECVVVKCLHYC